MSSTPAITDSTMWALDREIVREIVRERVLDAPREAVFAERMEAVRIGDLDVAGRLPLPGNSPDNT